MPDERWQRIEELYHAARVLSALERGAFLAQACGTDEELRREIEALLAAPEQAGSFIAGNASADQTSQIVAPTDQLASEDQPTAMLPNPLLNPARDTAQRTINQYRVISRLGKGGMGEVWLAEDTRLKRQVALKLLPTEFTNDADRLRRFEQEALAISALNHPNIITIHEIGESEAGRFIVMELVAGQTLRALAAEPVTLDLLIAWGSQLAKALHAAPKEFGSGKTLHRYFQHWVRRGIFKKMWKAGLLEYDETQGIEWAWPAADGAMTKAPLGGGATGPHPTDRGKSGTRAEPAGSWAWRTAWNRRAGS